MSKAKEVLPGHPTRTIEDSIELRKANKFQLDLDAALKQIKELEIALSQERKEKDHAITRQIQLQKLVSQNVVKEETRQSKDAAREFSNVSPKHKLSPDFLKTSPLTQDKPLQDELLKAENEIKELKRVLQDTEFMVIEQKKEIERLSAGITAMENEAKDEMNKTLMYHAEEIKQLKADIANSNKPQLNHIQELEEE
eukprot:388362-Hanusia_phi.AAC.2